MYIRHHFLSCILLLLILFPLFNYISFLVFIFGFFIDVDHYLYDIIRFRNLNLKKSYLIHMDKKTKIKDQLHIFHTIEFLILFVILTIIYNNVYLLLLIIGFLLHWILDFIYFIHEIIKKEKLNQTTASFLIGWIYRHY